MVVKGEEGIIVSHVTWARSLSIASGNSSGDQKVPLAKKKYNWQLMTQTMYMMSWKLFVLPGPSTYTIAGTESGSQANLFRGWDVHHQCHAWGHFPIGLIQGGGFNVYFVLWCFSILFLALSCNIDLLTNNPLEERQSKGNHSFIEEGRTGGS